jgi:hypothetical protein
MTVTLKNDTAKLLKGFSREDGTPVEDLVQLLLEQSIAISGEKYEAGRVGKELARMEAVVAKGSEMVERAEKLNARLRKRYIDVASENMGLQTMMNGGRIPAGALPQGLKQ